MKFATKLFLFMTSLIALIFTVFGVWMLHSNFSQILNREIEQGNRESQMFQYLFEMGYQTNQEYGGAYAVNKTLDGIMSNIEKDGTNCFVFDTEGNYLYGNTVVEGFALQENIAEIEKGLSGTNTYAYGLRQIDEKLYVMVSICVSEMDETPIYLGMCRDITAVYTDRQHLLNQYSLALAVLLLVAGVSIYILAGYITAPIRKLESVAGKIAGGDYSLRSQITSEDEIGELSESFNLMADELVKHMQEKELEAKQKEDFTAAFAHELKTPLTSIIGYADMLNTMKLTEEECREAYYYIFSQGKRLESLSHKLLNLVSLDKHPISYMPNKTKDLADNILATMRPIWKKKGIMGKVHLEKGVIYGDAELLLSLFYNLLDNAVKAVEAGGFILMKGSTKENGYEIKIVDNGRGIPEEEIDRITEAFYMVDKSRSRKEGGAGIGMALCKQIIELHKGTLSISSKLGMGTVIAIFFPDMEKEETREGKERE